MFFVLLTQPPAVHDFHAHSTYSDGSAFRPMLEAAVEAGLEGVGFADHCSLTTDPGWRRQRDRFARHFDLTYERRRAALERLRDEHDIAIYDAVEVDYEPGLEDAIRSFLADAEFDYALGSVHYVGEHVVFAGEDFSSSDAPDPASFVADYYDAVVRLVESELFDVAAHVDLVEAHPQLAGLRSDEHVERLVDALAESRTVPEVNAKRAKRDGKPDFHPSDGLFDALVERGVQFTVGTDTHRPEEFAGRTESLRAFVDERGLDPVSPV